MSVGTIGDLACAYATLLLHDDGIPVTAEKISAVVKAANVKLEAYWPSLFAKLVERKSVDDLIVKVGSAGAAAAPAPAPAPASVTFAPAPAAEVTKKEEAQVMESDEEDFSLNLFN